MLPAKSTVIAYAYDEFGCAANISHGDIEAPLVGFHLAILHHPRPRRRQALELHPERDGDFLLRITIFERIASIQICIGDVEIVIV